MTIKNELKKYPQIKSIEREDGLIDDCKMMVTLKPDYTHIGYGMAFGIKSLSELKHFMKDVTQN